MKEIPAFDVPLAYSLYATLLAPVEEIWRPARNLLVVANGSLGFLPLGLLPTAADQPDARPRHPVRRIPQRAVAGARSRDHGDPLGVDAEGAANDETRRRSSGRN